MSEGPAFGSEMNRHMTAKQAEITGRFYCTTHQGMAPLEGSTLRGARRVCATCTSNRKNRVQTFGRK